MRTFLVIGAKQIIPLDTNGLSDPFVVIELVPKCRYPTTQVFKTKVVSKSLNPIFDETFELYVWYYNQAHRQF